MGILYTKNNDTTLDDAIERALAEGPLTVIRPGKPAMVVLSAEDYERLGGERAPVRSAPSLIDCLLRRPLDEGIDLDQFIGERHRPTTRPATSFDGPAD